MNDDELKSLYRNSSTEQPSAETDARILAAAAEELDEAQGSTKTVTGWRPVFATAASVTLVVALAFQLMPQQQQEWPEIAPAEIMVDGEQDKAVESQEITTVTGARMRAEEEVTEAAAKVNSAQSFAAAPQSTSQEERSVTDQAHSRVDKLRSERIAKRQLERKKALQEQATLAQSAPSQTSEPLSQAGLQQELQRILSLFKEGERNAAELAWQQLQERQKNSPTQEPNKSLWQQVSQLFVSNQ